MNRWDNLKYKYTQLSIAEKIIVINVICFLIPFVFNSVFYLFQIPTASFSDWVQLSPDLNTFITRPWTLITYSFQHADFFHLLWNMIFLNYSGRLILNLFPGRIFINNYFLGAITGGIIFLLSYSLFPVFRGSYPPMVGASAGVMAVFVFICTYNPEHDIRVFFFNTKLKYLGLVFFSLDVIQIPYGNAGGHLAHIGGAILGFLYARQLGKGNDIGIWFENIWKSILKKKLLKTVYRSPKSKPVKSQKSDKNNQVKIDAILDKIGKSGYDSLSKEEKDFLFRAGKH
jgi:membrane associated rhomboid family serine protease